MVSLRPLGHTRLHATIGAVLVTGFVGSFACIKSCNKSTVETLPSLSISYTGSTVGISETVVSIVIDDQNEIGVVVGNTDGGDVSFGDRDDHDGRVYDHAIKSIGGDISYSCAFCNHLGGGFRGEHGELRGPTVYLCAFAFSGPADIFAQITLNVGDFPDE